MKMFFWYKGRFRKKIIKDLKVGRHEKQGNFNFRFRGETDQLRKSCKETEKQLSKLSPNCCDCEGGKGELWMKKGGDVRW